MTHIDESLAKGLASRFLTECDESVNQFMDRLARTNRKTSTKKGRLSKSAQVEKEPRSAAFSTHWVGSNSKPARGFIGIGPEKQRFNTWEEKCLTGINTRRAPSGELGGLPKRSIEILSGQTSRIKRVLMPDAVSQQLERFVTSKG